MRYGYLKKEDAKKANAVEAAKKKYQDELGEPVQVKSNLMSYFYCENCHL